MIISSGLNDRSKYLQQYVRNIMLKSWLKFVDGNIIELLKCFDVTYDDNSYNTAALVLKVLSHNTVYIRNEYTVLYHCTIPRCALYRGIDKIWDSVLV